MSLSNLGPVDMALVYQRDASWWPRPGRATQYHFPRTEDPALSQCNRTIGVLNIGGLPPEEVPTSLRCQRRGCKERWRGRS